MSYKFRFVLVNPSHPGNIGAVARAMQNMDISELYIVGKLISDISFELAVSKKGSNLLNNIVWVNSLEEALKDVDYSISTTARNRDVFDRKFFTAQEIVQKTKLKITNYQVGKVAFVFGPEKTGLTNDEILFTNDTSYIPSSDIYSALNLSHAVIIYAYELNKVFNEKNKLTFKSNKTVNKFSVFSKEEKLITMFNDFLHVKFKKKELVHNSYMKKFRSFVKVSNFTHKEIDFFMGIINKLKK